MKKKQIGVFLDPEDIARIEDICRRTGDSKSALIRRIVKDYLRREEKVES